MMDQPPSLTGRCRVVGGVVWLVMAAAMLPGCGGEKPADFMAVHSVTSVGAEMVTLSLNGMVVGHEPTGHRAINPWIPIEALQPEGVEVDRGDAMIGLSDEAAANAVRLRDLEISEGQAEQDATVASTEQTIRKIRDEQVELRQQIALFDAQIAATHRRDDEAIAVARLEVELSGQRLDAASAHLDRIRRLGSIAGAVEARDAARRQALAEQAVRVPEAELEYLESVTRSISRRLLQLDRQVAAITLGGSDTEGGLGAAIAVLETSREAEIKVGVEALKRMQRYQVRDTALLQDNQVRAKVAGVIRYRVGGLSVGGRPRRSTAIYVVRPEDLALEFDLPERWRHLVTVFDSDDPVAGRVRVDVPPLGVRDVEARVRSISMKPYPTRRGRAYRCHVQFDRMLPGLRDGMTVNVRVPVRVSPGAVQIPRWAVSGNVDRWVRMADGTRRRVRGWAVGTQFIIEEGLRVGEQVQAVVAKDANGGSRITGIVEPQESIQLGVPWRVEIIEMVGEGSMVRKGDVVATVFRLRGDMMRDTYDERIAQAHLEGASELKVARMEALSALRDAYAAWQASQTTIARARLVHLVERYGSFDQQQIAGDVALVQARIALGESRHALSDLEAAAEADIVSVHEVREGRLEVDQAVLRLQKQEVAAAASLRMRDWITVWEKQEASGIAYEKADELRSAYSLQREEYQLAMARAQDNYQSKQDHAQRLRVKKEEEIVRAPFDGRVFYNFDDASWRTPRYRPLKIGRRLRTTYPFYMPVDDRRVIRLEVPLRFYRRLSEGADVAVHLSVFGGRPVAGKVLEASPFFHPPRVGADEYVARGMLGVPPMVFSVTIGLDLPDNDASQVPYGVLAWIHLDA